MANIADFLSARYDEISREADAADLMAKRLAVQYWRTARAEWDEVLADPDQYSAAKRGYRVGRLAGLGMVINNAAAVFVHHSDYPAVAHSAMPTVEETERAAISV